MSEPRKLYTGSASGGLDQEQYEAARRRAQQLAEQNARRRTVQQPMRTAQGATSVSARRPSLHRNRCRNPYRSRCSSLPPSRRPRVS